ncbi:MAG: Holliday junction resolvase RuvX [Deltaproteobacteria bacterium]|nr:MAG: Holliday junction resolvase RuvX [Deltaproteobacteria bacterium]
MRILGLDLGEKNIGVAISDEFGWSAQGLTTLTGKSRAEFLKKISVIIAEYKAEQIVLGMPRNMDGSLGPRAESTLSFGEKLKARFNLPLTYWDERLSTVAAERPLLEANLSRKKRKKVIDKLAAVYILQGYLDSIKKE